MPADPLAGASPAHIRALILGARLITISVPLFVVVWLSAVLGGGLLTGFLRIVPAAVWVLGCWKFTAQTSNASSRRWESATRIWLVFTAVLSVLGAAGPQYWPEVWSLTFVVLEVVGLMVGYYLGLTCAARIARRIPSPSSRQRIRAAFIVSGVAAGLLVAAAAVGWAGDNHSSSGLLGFPDPVILLALALALLGILTGIAAALMTFLMFARIHRDLRVILALSTSSA